MAAKSSRHPDIGVADGMLMASGGILSHARSQLASRHMSDATAVHEFRKAMKRWRAMLRLLEPYLGKEGARLRVEARDLARQLSGARDVRAALDALNDLGGGERSFSARTRAAIKSELEKRRSRAEEKTLTRGMRVRLRNAVGRATQATHHWPLDRLRAEDIATRLSKSYARAQRAVPNDWARATPAELHEFRQRVVILRYQMDLINPILPKIKRGWIAEAQRLRNRLGEHQDLDVLASFAAPRRPLARWRSRLTPLIIMRQAEHVASASRVAEHLFADKPKEFRRRLISMWDKSGGKKKS